MTIHTPDWVKDAVFYQIFPDRFAFSERVPKPNNLEPWNTPPTVRGFKGGDLLGVKERLDYLEALGINALYFNPIFTSAANHRYHTHDYYSVDPILGGNAAFREMLEAAHARGIRVVLDGVFNHASRGFLQFNHILENGAKSPYVNWFHVTNYPLYAFDGQRPANYACWWNNRELPKLNTDNLDVREFIYDVAEYWLHQGIDGWRLDVPLEITTPGFWEEFRRRVKGVNAEAYILAEIWSEARSWLQGEHFDAVMNYPFNRACLGFFGGSALNTSLRPGGFALHRLDARAFGQQVVRDLELYDWEVVQAQYNLLSSHDEPRFLTVVDGEQDRLRLATLFQMTYPGAPSIYYGDEIGLEGGPDPDSRRAFPWAEARWHVELLNDFRRYVALRHDHPVLRRGAYVQLLAEDHLYAFARQDAQETLIVIFNAGEQEQAFALDVSELAPTSEVFKDVWSASSFKTSAGLLAGSLPALSALVLEGQATRA